MFTSLKHNLGRLATFSGRETPALFWPYAAVAVVFSFAGAFLVLLPVMYDTMARMQSFAKKHPELVTVNSTPTSYSMSVRGFHPELFPDIGRMMVNMDVVILVFAIFLAGAISRRLHDIGRTGLWGCIPLFFLISGSYILPKAFTLSRPDPLIMLGGFANNMIYLASLIFLIVCLAQKSSPGTNRYGPAPD